MGIVARCSTSRDEAPGIARLFLARSLQHAESTQEERRQNDQRRQPRIGEPVGDLAGETAAQFPASLPAAAAKAIFFPSNVSVPGSTAYRSPSLRPERISIFSPRVCPAVTNRHRAIP